MELLLLDFTIRDLRVSLFLAKELHFGGAVKRPGIGQPPPTVECGARLGKNDVQ